MNGRRLAGLLLAGACLASLAKAGAVVPSAKGRIDQLRLGFALGPEGWVSPGCAASTFSLHDPIHLSVQVTGVTEGSMLRISVRDVATKRVAWSASRAVTPGSSFQTFEIGRELAVGRYRVESTFDGIATKPWAFAVHDQRPVVQSPVASR